MVREMGFFDDWQAQKDSQYILVTEYIEHLAREHSSSLFATVEYLQVNFSELKIYSKSFAGKFCIANTSLDNGFQRDFNAETVFIYIKDFLSINKKVDTLTFKENTTKFSHYYFKKSELPVIEPVKPSEPQASEINSQITLLQRDPLLTSLDDYSILEASCLISGDDFLEIERCYNDTNFDKNYAEYLRAERLISAGIKAKVLDLTRPSLQKFLKEKGYIIAGFNDKLPLAPADKIGHATITQTMPTDSQLSQQVADLKAQLASAGDKIDSQAELIAELKEQLASIEQASNDTQSDTPADNELLTAIYDDSKPYLYAPELHNAIEVWKLIYHDNLTSQHLTTHSDKFESAIKQLGITFANNAPKERLKQITTPQQQKEKTKPKNS